MLKELKNLFAFLTIIPLRMDQDCLTDSAKFMFVFPLVGGFIGTVAGLFGWLVDFFLPGLIVGALVLGILLLLTGLHHADGLLDFGDAIMVHGTAEKKIEVMHDQLTGAGGLTLGILTYLITAFTLGELSMQSGNQGFTGLPTIISVLAIVEVAAKLSMVVAAWAGKAVHAGTNSPFLEAMHGTRGNGRFVVALAISFGIALPLLWIAGVLAMTSAVISSLVIVGISHKHFKGVTGDVFGATNELARMVSAIVLLAVI
jgi:adenosylcobinamide-GDP ribazoletransferase